MGPFTDCKYGGTVIHFPREERERLRSWYPELLHYPMTATQKGNFKPEVGSKVVEANPNVRKRRVTSGGTEE